MPFRIDGSLYPDEPAPEQLVSQADRLDFLARLCGAWDFGILPDTEPIEEIRRPEWRASVDEARLLTSVSYHLLRRWHQLPEAPWLGQRVAAIDDDPSLDHV